MCSRPSEVIPATIGNPFVSADIYIGIYKLGQGILPVSTGIAKLALVHGRCASCGEAISQLLAPCDCGSIPRHISYDTIDLPYLVVRIPFDDFSSPNYVAYKKAIRDAQYMQNSYNRKAVLDSGPKASKEQLQQLWDAQEGRCIYCGKKLITNRGDIHIDHVLAVSRGGSGAIENLAYTCSKCNLSKGICTYEVFVDYIDMMLPSRQRAITNKIRRQRNQFLTDI